MKKILIIGLVIAVLFGCSRKEEQRIQEPKVVTLYTNWKIERSEIDKEAYKEEMPDLSDEEFEQKMKEFAEIVSIENATIKELTLNEDGTYKSDYVSGEYQVLNDNITLNGIVYDEPVMIVLKFKLDETGLILILDKEIYHYVEA